jgi:pyruvate,water dikinase
VDRDSEIVAFDFDERDPGMLEMFKLAVLGAKRNGRHIGICGEAPANYPEIARFLAQIGIDAISFLGSNNVVNTGTISTPVPSVRTPSISKAKTRISFTILCVRRR